MFQNSLYIQCVCAVCEYIHLFYYSSYLYTHSTQHLPMYCTRYMISTTWPGSYQTNANIAIVLSWDSTRNTHALKPLGTV